MQQLVTCTLRSTKVFPRAGRECFHYLLLHLRAGTSSEYFDNERLDNSSPPAIVQLFWLRRSMPHPMPHSGTCGGERVRRTIQTQQFLLFPRSVLQRTRYAMKKRSVGDLCHKHRRNAVGKAPDVSPVRLKSGKVLLQPVDDGLAGD